MRKLFAVFAVVSLLAVPLWGQTKDLPLFPQVNVLSRKGEVVPISQLYGKATILNFWATWCGPCKVELPELAKLYAELKDHGLAVVAIDTEGPQAPVGSFLEDHKLDLPVYFLDPPTLQALGIDQIPFSVLLDRDGRVVRYYSGYSQEGMQNLRGLAEGLVRTDRGQGGT